MPGSTPDRPGWLASRHPLPEIQDNKAEHTAETRAADQMTEDNKAQIHYGPKSERLPLPPHYAEPEGTRAARVRASSAVRWLCVRYARP